LAAQRKQTPSGSITVGTDASLRGTTPLPESRERPTASGLDARKVGTASPAEERAASDARALSRATARPTGRFASYAPPPVDRSREAPTEPAAPLSSAPDQMEPTRSVGYYSLRPSQMEAVRIPRAPRVPELDLEEADEAPPYRPPGSSRPSSMITEFDGLGPSPSQAPETIRTPPPSLVPRRRRISTPPPAMQESVIPGLPEEEDERRFDSMPPTLYFAPHVRAQANQWAETGSLSLPGCSSPRHARALQRALLLALLHEPGWFGIPQGLRQRAGWLFCDGWESAAGNAHPFREIDDLAAVLGLPCTPESRRMLSTSISRSMPNDFSTRRSPSSRPPSRF
jgi:hypothetical protein